MVRTKENNSYKLLQNMIKEQNRQLLNKIADFLRLDDEQRIELFDEFWKSSYHSPVLTGSIKIEKLQGYMLR